MRKILLIAFLFSSVLAGAQTIPQKQVVNLVTDLAGKAATITNTDIAYVESTGNNTTGTLGRSDKPFLTIAAAIAALPSGGGVVKIGLGTFVSPSQSDLDKDNISLIGSGTPVPNWSITQASLTSVTRSAPTALTGGTILNGSLAYVDRSGIVIKDLGVDVGSAYTTGGGTEGNGIGIGASTSNEAANTPAPSYTLEQGILIENVICLLKNSASLFHGLVIETHAFVTVRNFTEIYGVHGVALKVTGGDISNVRCYGNDYDGIIIKANDYSVGTGIKINGFEIYGSAKGIVFQNRSNASLKDIRVLNGYITGCTTGISTEDDFDAGFSGVIVSNVNVRGATTAFDNSSNYSVVACNVNGTLTGSVTNIIAGSGISVSSSNGVYTVSRAGDAVSGDIDFPTNDDLTETSNEWGTASTDGLFGHTGLSTTYLAAGQSGGIYFQCNTTLLEAASSGILGFHLTNAETGFISMLASIQMGVSGVGVEGDVIARYTDDDPVADDIEEWVVGTYYGLFRDGATGVFTVKKSTDEISWEVIYTFPSEALLSTAALYVVCDIGGAASNTINQPQYQFEEVEEGGGTPITTSEGNVIVGTGTNTAAGNTNLTFLDGVLTVKNTSGLRFQDYTASSAWAAIYPDGVTPAANNYSLAIKNDGTEIYTNASVQNGLAVGTAVKLSVNADAVVKIANGTAPSDNPSGGAYIYAASNEMAVKDGSGNSTTISPHNFSGIPQGKSEEMAWAFYSEKDGKYINVDMLKLARLLEKLTGEKLVYIGDKK